MEDPKLPQNVSSLLDRLRLKRPSEKLLANYSTQVDQKINQALNVSHGFQVPRLLLAFVFAAAFAGLYYMYALRQQMPDIVNVKQPEIAAAIKKAETQSPKVSKTISSIEEEIAALESLDPEFEDELLDLLEEENLLEDFVAFDEAEFTAAGLQTSMTR